MNLLEKIEADLTTAMKARNEQTVSTLRMLRSSIKNAVIAARTTAKTELDDLDIQKVVKAEVKKLRDALIDFTAAARQDLIDKTNAELEILKNYMPAELSMEELEEKVSSWIKELKEAGEVEFGQAMKYVNERLKGAADGKAISEAVKKYLT